MCTILDELCKYYAKWKKSITKYYIFYDSIYIKCLEYTNQLVTLRIFREGK
jgi:hypothetical protein